MKTAILTICAKNYAAYALTLYESLQRAGEMCDFFWIVSDEFNGSNIETPNEMHVIEAKNIISRGFADMAFRYDVTELSTAIKPFCILALLARDYDRVIYLDPDIYVISKFEEVHTAFDAGASAVLTPHICAPLEDGKHPDDLQILRVGTFNLGFAAFADNRDSQTFLEWWARRLECDCRIELEAGLFVDQKFVDLAPSFLDDLKILKHPGYNVAYWNLAHRAIARTEGGSWRANGQPVRFFHFSGVSPDNPDIYSKHQNRYDASNIGKLSEALRDYIKALNAHGYRESKSHPYSYDYYASGAKLPTVVRKAYARTAPRDEALTLSTAFGESAQIPRFLTAPIDGNPSSLSRLETEALLQRPDLATAFVMRPPKAFKSWFRSHGKNEFDLPGALAVEDGKDEERMGARLAGKILNARAFMRPFYRYLPMSLRTGVKRALLRRYTSNADEILLPTTANGVFDPNRRPGVQLYGFFGSASGVGQSARGTISAMKAADIPFATTRLRNPYDNRETAPFREKPAPPAGFRIALLHLNAEQLLRIGELMPTRHLVGQYRIGVWAWELAKFPLEWKAAMKYVDEIWAPTAFVANSIKQETDKPVHVVPHVIDVEHKQEVLAEERAFIGARTSFLTAFDAKSFISRKNPGAAITAFKKTFPASDASGPVLVVKANGVDDLRPNLRDLVELIGGANNIRLVTRSMQRDEYLSLMTAVDCFISLHRSEGFGLNIAEAMALGKPVIATNYSGEIDFYDGKVGATVSFDLVPTPEDAYPFATGQVWAEPHVDAAADALRKLAALPELRQELGKASAARIKENFSASAIGRKMRTRIHHIDPDLPLSQ